MQLHTCLATALALLAPLGTGSATSPQSGQPDGLSALDGVWIYVEDRTEGRPSEEHQPSMNAKITLRLETDALVWVRSKTREIRMALDGSPTEVSSEGSVSRYRGTWKDGVFAFESEPVREPDSPSKGLIRWELRVTAEGLLARVSVDPPSGFTSFALYRHPQDIALPAPAKAALSGMEWLAGAWVGTRGASGATSIEERWSAPLGGAMLAVSRTVSRGKMTAFEFLRIVEREGGLVYIAQPNGVPPTEFVLTELGAKRAVFENPRHDSPQRIVYEFSAEGRLTASIGATKGGRPQRFEFKREGG